MKIRPALAHWFETQGARPIWHRAMAAFAFGFAGALAFSPTGLFAILGISFPALIMLLRAVPTLRAAFITGWCFAFGYFLLGIYWIAAAMFVDISTFWWAVPLAVAGLPAVCAVYYGLAAMLARRMGLQGLAGTINFALCWFLADYARGHLLTGFPWNLEGYVWSDLLPVLQVTSVIGIYGLTLLTLVIACLPAALAGKHKLPRMALSIGALILILIGGWGFARLSGTKDEMTETRVRIVQPDIEQAHKWKTDERERHFQQLLNFTAAPSAKPLAAIIWPETAATFYLEEDMPHRRALAGVLGEGSIVLTGVIRRSLGEDGKVHFANSMIAVDRTSRIAARYDKVHLVPFGEYIPFRTIVPIRTLANLGVDFTPGPGLQTLRLDSLPPFSPLICYEAIFPGQVVREDDRPQLLINITNDGWYGKTAGPYQHFAIARVRAIEEGLPMVRAANTGISGMIDAYGRLIVKLGLGIAGSIDTDLPKALPPTFFSRYGEESLWVLFGCFAMMAAGLRRLRR